MNYSIYKEEYKTEVFGYNNIKYSIFELCLSANNYSRTHNKEYRKIIKAKYEKIYNYPYETIPINLLNEVYGLNETFKEIWKEVPGYNDKRYLVSNLGRIKAYGKIIIQDDTNFDGYLKMKEASVNGKEIATETPVYKFIALAFLGESEGKEIHHINNNGYDSRPENLIYLTSPDHSRVHDKKIKNNSNE